MKIPYFESNSGISGDMTLGALIDLGVPLDYLNTALRSLGVDGLRLSVAEVRRRGFRGKMITVHDNEHHHSHGEHHNHGEHHHSEHHHGHHEHNQHHEHAEHYAHRGLTEILWMIRGSELTVGAKETAELIFRNIAAAEAEVHGCDVERVHFHEVGAIDSIADIVGVAVGFDYLGIEQYAASPVPTGTGTITIAHGRCSVPAPATARLLTGIPLAESSLPYELTTPTGAAILSSLVTRYGALPSMSIDRIGYGAGGRDMAEQANVLRIILGDSLHPSSEQATPTGVWLIETNLDDITGEVIGYVQEQLWSLVPPPLDVWTTAIGMKKQRTGVQLSVLCRVESRETVEKLLLLETPTLGLRCREVERVVLQRENATVETPFGELKVKRAQLPDGTTRTTAEYESAKNVARKNGVPIREIYDWLAKNGK